MEKFYMYKEYPLDQYAQVTAEIKQSDEPYSMVLLMNYLGAAVISDCFLNYIDGAEKVEKIRNRIEKSEEQFEKETAGLIGRHFGAATYCIPDFPEKFVLITIPKPMTIN